MEVTNVLQDGSMFSPEVLDLSDEAIIEKFQKAVGIQRNLSLGLGYCTTLSAPTNILSGFKNLVAFSAASGYQFPQGQSFLEAIANMPPTKEVS